MNAEKKGLVLDARLCERAKAAGRAMRWCEVLGYDVLLNMVSRIVNPDTPEDYEHKIGTFKADILDQFGGFDLPFSLEPLADALRLRLESVFEAQGSSGGWALPRLHNATNELLKEVGRQLAKIFEWRDLEVVEAEFLALHAFEQDLRSYAARIDEAVVRELLDLPADEPITQRERQAVQSDVILQLEDKLS